MSAISPEEEKDGFVSIFNGKDLSAWTYDEKGKPGAWKVENAMLIPRSKANLYTEKEYDNFILKWDWKLGEHGNSGVLYHVVEGEKYNAVYETGPEYQLIEDGSFKDENGELVSLETWQETAADYAMYEANDQKQINVREWNSSKIVFSEEKAEYWLNGKKVVEFVPWSDDWNERRLNGKWEIDKYPEYGQFKTGKLSLQDHGSKVWFRNIKIKEL